MDYKILYKGYLTKAVTFSYDDGTFYDVFLTDIFNRYGFKGTFNINTGLYGLNTTIPFADGYIYHNRISEEQAKHVYAGHEIAGHSLHHPLLVNQPKEFLDAEVLPDLENIEKLTGEKTVGFAYPGGPHDEFTDAYMRNKVLYARGIQNTHSVELPQEFVPLEPTVFHMEEDFNAICEQYVASNPDHATWLYIWGHSYEFAIGDTYKNFLAACDLFAAQKDIWFATNKEIISYVLAARALRCESDTLYNDADFDVYVECKGKKVTVPAHGQCGIRNV